MNILLIVMKENMANMKFIIRKARGWQSKLGCHLIRTLDIGKYTTLCLQQSKIGKRPAGTHVACRLCCTSHTSTCIGYPDKQLSSLTTTMYKATKENLSRIFVDVDSIVNDFVLLFIALQEIC